MCLDTLHMSKFPKSGTGWKVFRFREDGSLRSDLKDTVALRPYNKWLTSTNTKIKKEYGTIIYSNGTVDQCKSFVYDSGFHIFETRKAARYWARYWALKGSAIRKVLYKNAVAHGEQHDHKVIVAKKIKILSPPKRAK